MPLMTAWTQARSTSRPWSSERSAPESTPAARPRTALPVTAATETEVKALVSSTPSRPIWITPARSAQMPPMAAQA